MVCIWATSLELSWGIIALRLIVKNVKDWVYNHVKPEISRWIHDIRQDRLQTYSLTPSGDVVTQRRRAASCQPTDEMVTFEKSGSQPRESRHHNPQGEKRPALPHGQTVPRTKPRVPKIQLNKSTESGGREIDSSSDEGYASVYTREWRENQQEEKKSYSAFICDDGLSEYDSNASYVPPNSEDESTGSESEEGEESGDDGASSNEDLSLQEEKEDKYDLSDGEIHYPRLDCQSYASTNLEVYCTPVKGYQSHKPAGSRSKSDRRRSSRF